MPSSRRMLSRLFLALGAVREKTGLRLPIATIVVHRIAEAVRKTFPRILRLHLVGSRLRHKYGRDVEFVAVVEHLEDMPSRNVVGLKIANLKVDLFFSLPQEVEASILEFGLGADIMRWKRAAIRKGLKLNRYGLWKNGKLVAVKMAEIAAILGMPLKTELVFSLENPL